MVNWCVALVTAVAALFGVPAAAAASPASPAVVNYADDVHHHSALTYTDTGTERDPHAYGYDAAAVPDAGDRWSNDGSARQDGPASCVTTNYDRMPQLALVAPQMGETARVDNGSISLDTPIHIWGLE